MAELVRNRSEILFLYDVKDANPNGDPVDENKPRIDEETGINIVTDVRLKRTIRDYLYEYKGLEVFVRETRNEDGNLRTKEDRLEDFGNNPDEIIKKCIDIRLFGATTAVKDKTMTITGPVQFKFGRSLHKVDLTFVKGTTVMPSRADARQGTFTERYILPYSLIAFYGIVNENAAQRQNLGLTEQDIELLLEGIWHGTKNLISGSKAGQTPRILQQIIYKENHFHIGELNRMISLISDKRDEEIRDISELSIDITELCQALLKHKDRIETVRYKIDDRVKLTKDGKDTTLENTLSGLSLQELNF